MIKTLILDKVRWKRGGSSNTLLINGQGKLCCLGVCMAQEGVAAADLLGLGEPAEPYNGGSAPHVMVDYLIRPVSVRGEFDDVYNNSSISNAAISINDNPGTTDEEKVERLNSVFSDVGINVILVDTPQQAAALGGLPVDFSQMVSE